MGIPLGGRKNHMFPTDVTGVDIDLPFSLLCVLLFYLIGAELDRWECIRGYQFHECHNPSL